MNASRKQLITALLKLVDESSDRVALANSIAAYLINERRSKELGGLLRTLERTRYENDGILEVHAASATPLSQEAKVLIKQLFKADKVQIHEEHDADLIGGVRLRALDKVADLSISTKLQKLSRGI